MRCDSRALRRRGGFATRSAILAIPVVLLVLLPAGGSVAGDREEAVGKDGDRAAFPVTVEKVWYRTEKNRGLGKSYKMGDLVVGTDFVEFVHKKRGWKVPIHELHMISRGKMRGDVDTEWIVVSLESAPQGSLKGLRDGRKMGFGTRTGEIYRILKDAARQAGAAQFDVPDRFRTYEELDHMFTIAFPEDWTAYNRSKVLVDGRIAHGTVVFFQGKLREEDLGADPDGRSQALDRLQAEIDSGSRSSFAVERKQAARGMSCEGLDRSAVMDLATASAAGWTEAEAPRIESMEVDICSGLRFRMRGINAAGESSVADVVAVSDGRILYLMRVDTLASHYDTALGPFEKALTTVRFAVAR